MNVQLKHKMDVMTWEPGYVRTNMTKLSHDKVTMSTPERAVEACFRDIGNDAHTHGCLGHEVTALMLQFMPQAMLNRHDEEKT